MAVNGKVSGEVLHGKAVIPGLIPGERGKSAYEVAVDNGFKGTEAEWLASLKGDGIPPITAADADKVLTANADGTAEWKEPTGGGGSAAIYAGTVTTTDTGNGNVLGNLGVALSLTQGAAYKVTFNGIDYKCVGSKEDVYPYLGNAHFLNDSREDTGEPFCLTFATNTTYLETAAAGSYTLAIYEETGGGLSVTEVSSPEEITADSPDGFYVVPGGGSGGSGGGGGTPIHYFDSLEAAMAANLSEGSFVAVPSSGYNGFALVEITTPLVHGGALSSEEGAAIDKAYTAGLPFIVKVESATFGDKTFTNLSAFAICANAGAHAILISAGTEMVMFVNMGTAWGVMIS